MKKLINSSLTSSSKDNLKYLLGRILANVNIAKFKAVPEEELRRAAKTTPRNTAPLIYLVLLYQYGILKLENGELCLEEIISPKEIISVYLFNKIKEVYPDSTFRLKDLAEAGLSRRSARLALEALAKEEYVKLMEKARRNTYYQLTSKGKAEEII